MHINPHPKGRKMGGGRGWVGLGLVLGGLSTVFPNFKLTTFIM